MHFENKIHFYDDDKEFHDYLFNHYGPYTVRIRVDKLNLYLKL